MVMIEDIEYQLKTLIKEICPTVEIAELNKDTSLLRDIGLDSVQIIELVVTMEEHFKIPIVDDNLSADLFDRFEELLLCVQQKVQMRAQA